MTMLVVLVVVIVLVLLNGLFVAAEFAIVGAPRAVLERRAARGGLRARLLAGVLRDPRSQDRFIATAQLGITLASLGLGMYGEHHLAEWFAGVLEPLGVWRWFAAHSLATVIAVGILTYLHIVIGEMVPKSLALQFPERTALMVILPMRAVQLALYPLVRLLDGIGTLVLRSFGVRRETGGREHISTPEELAYIVRESHAGGMLSREPARFLRELLEFPELTAEDVMVPRVRVSGVPLGAGTELVEELLRTSPHSRYPVYDGTVDRIVGMLHVKDILTCLPDCPPVTRERVRPLAYVPGTAGLDEILAAMRKVRAQMAVVMDEHGGTAGIVTIEDLFEEVLGEITEDATEQRELRVEDDGTVIAAGTARLEDIGEALGVTLEHEDVFTASGLVLAILNRPPIVGDSVEYMGVRFSVRRVEGHGVAECAVTRVTPGETV